jgi:hypothetical protein
MIVSSESKLVPEHAGKLRAGLPSRSTPWIGLIAALSILCAAPSLADGDAVVEETVIEESAIEESAIEETAFMEDVDMEFVGLSVLDLLVLRPLGVVSTLGGLVVFLASTPFVIPTGRIGTAWDIFVYGSFDDTFVRPLGEI